MIDAVKSYVQMASGILEATAAKAKQTAEQVVSQAWSPAPARRSRWRVNSR